MSSKGASRYLIMQTWALHSRSAQATRGTKGHGLLRHLDINVSQEYLVGARIDHSKITRARLVPGDVRINLQPGDVEIEFRNFVSNRRAIIHYDEMYAVKQAGVIGLIIGQQIEHPVGTFLIAVKMRHIAKVEVLIAAGRCPK